MTLKQQVLVDKKMIKVSPPSSPPSDPAFVARLLTFLLKARMMKSRPVGCMEIHHSFELARL